MLVFVALVATAAEAAPRLRPDRRAVSGAVGGASSESDALAQIRAILAGLRADADFLQAGRRLDEILDRVTGAAVFDRAEVFVEAAFARRWVRVLEQVSEKDRAAMLAMHRQHPAFVRQLMLALRSEDAPRGVASLALRLATERGKAVSEFPQLATAVCVVHDVPLSRQVVENSAKAPDALAIFDYYSKLAGHMAFDMKRTPPGLLIWVVDTTASIDEMQWALRRYKGKQLVGRVYFEVRYDEDHFKLGIPKRVSQEGFTLPNLHRYGGVCADQAYYASSVGKALGIPTVQAKAEAGQVFHAWVGFMHRRGRGAAWNFESGRYHAYKNLRGMVLEPQTRRSIPDSFVSLTAAQVAVPDARRWHATALVDAMERVLDVRAGGKKALAASWVEMFDRVLVLNLADARVWDAVGRAAGLGLLDLPHKRHVASKLMKVSGEAYPDFTLAVLSKLISAVDDVAEKDRLWVAAAKIVRRRPELVAEAMMSRAEMWARAGKPQRAGALYEQVVMQYANAGPFVVEALLRTEEQLVALGRGGSVLTLFDQTLGRISKPGKFAPQFRVMSNWYRVAVMYRDRLVRAGRERQANSLQRTIEAYVGTEQ